MGPGSLVRIGTTGKIYSGISASDAKAGSGCFGIVLEEVDMQKELSLPRPAEGAYVYTQGQVELFFMTDLEEVR